MPEVIFNGPAGRLEGRYQPSKEKSAPIALILHPHPQFGGTMNNQIVYQLFYMFQKRGFTTLRFNFRASAAARANSTTAPANFPMPHRRSIGYRACTLIRRPVGSPATPSAPGSACSS
jgi:predicted alpha/beta-hydrolase family hydrolase